VEYVNAGSILSPSFDPPGSTILLSAKVRLIVTDDHQVGAHAQKAADRQNRVWLLAVACYKEIVNLADRFFRIVDDATTDDFGRPIAVGHLLHIDLGDLYRLWNALCFNGCSEPIIAAPARTIIFFIIISPSLGTIFCRALRHGPSPPLPRVLCRELRGP